MVFFVIIPQSDFGTMYFFGENTFFQYFIGNHDDLDSTSEQSPVMPIGWASIAFSEASALLP